MTGKKLQKVSETRLGMETGFSLAACLSRRIRTEAAFPKPLTQPSLPVGASFSPSE